MPAKTDQEFGIASPSNRHNRSVRHAGQNARHNQQTDTVADSILVNLFADPHQEDRAGGHGDRGHHMAKEDPLL